MKPIKLELSGLNSYSNKISIDFDKLTEKGMFGIFGNTGSGKSTILDAITIALYGDTSQDNRDFINSNCDIATVSYKFEVGSKVNRRAYNIDRIITRSEIGTKTSEGCLVEIHKNGEKTLLTNNIEDIDNKIVDTLGLTLEDFTKSIILPQGKFNEFLKLTGCEKRDMLERIFSLEKYGKELIGKIRSRKLLQSEYLRDINTKLNQYSEVSESLYESIESNLIELKELEKNKNEQFKLEQDAYTQYHDIYEKQVQKEKYEKRKKELDLKSQDIREKGIQLENALHAEKISPYIQNVQELEKKVDEDIRKNESLQKNLDILGKELIISKNKYDEAYTSKNTQIPKLSEYRIKLQIASELEKDLIILEKEIKDIKIKENSLDKEREILFKTSTELDSKRLITSKSLKELEDKIEKLKISADLKQKIFKAFEIEKEYNKTLEYKNVKEDRISKISKNLDEINLKIKYVQRDKSLLERKLNEITIHNDSLAEKCPGKNEDIIIKTEEIYNLKLEIEMLKEHEIKREKLQLDLNQLLENKHQIDREIHSLNDKLELTKRNKNDLKKEIETLKYFNLAIELRKQLKDNLPCPVCASRHHHNKEENTYDEKIEFLGTKLDRIKNEAIIIKNSIDELNCKKHECIAVERIKKKDIEYIKNKVGSAKSSELCKKLGQEVKILELLKLNIQRWQQDKEQTQETLKQLMYNKNSIEKEELKLQENINSYKKTIKEIKEELEIIDNNFKNIKEEYFSLKSIVKVQELQLKVKEINDNEKQIEELNAEYLTVHKRKESIEEKINSYQKHIYDIELQLIKAKEIYSEKKKIRENKYNEVIAITKGESSELLLNTLDENIEKLVNMEESTKKKLEDLTKQYDKYAVEKSNIDGRLKTTKDQYDNQHERLKQLLIDYKFDSIYTVKRALLDSGYRRKLHDDITEYNEEQRKVDIKVEELKDLLSGQTVKPKIFEDLKLKIYNLKSELTQISKDIGVNENKLQILKESLSKIKELNKVQEEAKYKLSLLEELDNLVQENRFVQYVATNQLKYITLEAAKNLSQMTEGRYYLGIDSDLNFVVKDNLNGGKIRSIDTLSGGETFLTSLSLALALSSGIQLKGNAQLETLFLDEGFGSLDSVLLDNIISGLERLNKDKLSIGIISHVDELQDRVPIKLIVSQDGSNINSKVRIEHM